MAKVAAHEIYLLVVDVGDDIFIFGDDVFTGENAKEEAQAAVDVANKGINDDGRYRTPVEACMLEDLLAKTKEYSFDRGVQDASW